MEERKEALSGLQGSQPLSWSAFLLILDLCCLFYSHPLNFCLFSCVPYSITLFQCYLFPHLLTSFTRLPSSPFFFLHAVLPRSLLTFPVSLSSNFSFFSSIFLCLPNLPSFVLASYPFFYLASLSLSFFAVGPRSPIPTLDWSQSLPPLFRGDWVLNWASQEPVRSHWLVIWITGGYPECTTSWGSQSTSLITCPSNSKWLFNDIVVDGFTPTQGQRHAYLNMGWPHQPGFVISRQIKTEPFSFVLNNNSSLYHTEIKKLSALTCVVLTVSKIKEVLCHVGKYACTKRDF